MRLPWNKENAELDREVAFHIETLADAFQAEGMSRAEAIRRARREFGGVDQVKEDCRDASRWRWVVEALTDLRFGWRMMKKSPTVSIAAVVSLALGIGATTAIYSFADAVLWRKLAVSDPEQMVEVLWTAKSGVDMVTSSSGSNYRDQGLQVADYFSKPAVESIRQSVAGKLDVAAHMYPQTVSAVYGGNVTVSRVRGVSTNFFSTLRLRPFAGELLGGEHDKRVVVSWGFWDRHLSRDPKVVGQTIYINGFGYTISGVLPREFVGLSPGDDTELYTTIMTSPNLAMPDSWYRARTEDPRTWWLQLIARRAEGVSIEQARTMLQTAFARTWPAQPKSAENTPEVRLVDASTGLGGLRRQMGSPAVILLGLVSMVLLVACANIANLLLARAAEREKEVGLRVSLGCASGRLMRQFFTESLLMAALGGALSISVALAIGSFMQNVLPQNLDASTLLVDLSARSIAATAAITLATALLFGLYPAWRASRVDAAPAIKEGTGTAGTMSRGRLVPARMLVLAQVALGVLLVTAAIIYTGNLNHIVNKDAGFERGHVLLFDLRPGELGYKDQRLADFYNSVEAQLKAIPGVAEVGLSRTRPMRGGGYHDRVKADGAEKGVSSAVHHASAGFMAALGVPVVAGRAFSPEEVRAGRKVAIISEDLAKRLNLSSPVGATITTEDSRFEVIGVARNASYGRLTQPLPVTYVPLPSGRQSVTVLLRTHVAPTSIVSAARQAVASLDRSVPLVDVFTMEQQISRTLQRERMFAWLCGSFGVLALVLCVVGIYGLMSYSTARRTPEIGIRMALGASARTVMRQVVTDGLRLATVGIVLGVPLAIYGAKLAQKQEMLPAGPLPYWTLTAAIAALIVSALFAVSGPAIRAASIDPMRALRHG